MTIAEARQKCKTLIARIPRDALLLAVLILVASASFGLGFLAGKEAGPSTGSGQGSDFPFSITTEDPSMTIPVTAATSNSIVASKNGTKYYLPGCSGVDRISAANKIFFASAAAAEAQGYQLASGCKAP